MPLFLYLDYKTFLHRRHPLVKVLALVLFFVSAFLMEHPLLILPLSTGVVALIVWSRATPNLYRFRMFFLLTGLVTVPIWSLFYGRGQRLAAAPFLPITREGLLYGLGMATKLSTFFATGALVLSTTRIEEFAYAFTLLGLPYRVSFTLTLAFRLVPLFVESALTVIQAQRCRGLDVHQGSIWQRLRHYVFVLIPVFMGALRRADQMAIALEVRGFNSGRPRSSFQRAAWTGGDVAALLVVLVVTALYLSLWKAGYGRITSVN